MLRAEIAMNTSILVAIVAYVLIGTGFLGGYRHWGLPTQFAYAGAFPLHWFLYQAYRFRNAWLPLAERHLCWVPFLLKLLIAYLLLKWWMGYPPWELLGDWFGELWP